MRKKKPTQKHYIGPFASWNRLVGRCSSCRINRNRKINILVQDSLWTITDGIKPAQSENLVNFLNRKCRTRDRSSSSGIKSSINLGIATKRLREQGAKIPDERKLWSHQEESSCKHSTISEVK